jgi:hypothetical protein
MKSSKNLFAPNKTNGGFIMRVKTKNEVKMFNELNKAREGKSVAIDLSNIPLGTPYGLNAWRIPKGMIIRKIKPSDEILPRLIRDSFPQTDSSEYDVLEFKKKR